MEKMKEQINKLKKLRDLSKDVNLKKELDIKIKALENQTHILK